jgi:hypothetical protein
MGPRRRYWNWCVQPWHEAKVLLYPRSAHHSKMFYLNAVQVIMIAVKQIMVRGNTHICNLLVKYCICLLKNCWFMLVEQLFIKIGFKFLVSSCLISEVKICYCSMYPQNRAYTCKYVFSCMVPGSLVQYNKEPYLNMC